TRSADRGQPAHGLVGATGDQGALDLFAGRRDRFVRLARRAGRAADWDSLGATPRTAGASVDGAEPRTSSGHVAIRVRCSFHTPGRRATASLPDARADGQSSGSVAGHPVGHGRNRRPSRVRFRYSLLQGVQALVRAISWRLSAHGPSRSFTKGCLSGCGATRTCRGSSCRNRGFDTLALARPWPSSPGSWRTKRAPARVKPWALCRCAGRATPARAPRFVAPKLARQVVAVVRAAHRSTQTSRDTKPAPQRASSVPRFDRARQPPRARPLRRSRGTRAQIPAG